ncbi:MAG: recombination-associated protein RdgC [Zoogloeaceae bacterium]|jgi:recombination associated protein RdgC|nr:recombination-associated protein RdgC [Zoogloeaceae bacterium]
MWFKNLQIYRLPAPWSLSFSELAEQLGRGVFHPCGNLEAVSRGWVPPRARAEEGDLAHVAGGQCLITLMTESRLLPATVIQQETLARAEKQAAEQGYPPGRKALRDLKEQVRDELLPRAFTCRRKTSVWIDREHGWLGVDAGSLAKAEEALEHLRQCLDDLPLALAQTRISPTSAMADWLTGGDAPAGFTIDRDCELKAVDEERAVVRYVRHPLGDEAAAEIRAHIAAGKLPTRLALTWNERVAFVLTEKGEIKRLEFLDVLKEEVEQESDNADEIFDAEFTLMSGEFARFLPDLMDALGGLTAENGR